MQAPQTPTNVTYIPNSSQWVLKNAAEEAYLIQAAWPLTWKSQTCDDKDIPVFYVLDGNAYFFSAVEAARRCSMVSTSANAIIVGISYPHSEFVFHSRRNFDLTPPSATYTPPRDADGKEHPADHGGATAFLDFLINTVRTFIFSDAFPQLQIGKEVLIGHSYGGLCTLHALFTSVTPFQVFTAISPSIWWNDKFILTEQEEFLKKDIPVSSGQIAPKATVLFAYGTYEQDPCRRSDWGEGEYQKHLELARERSMGKNTEVMAASLKGSGRFENVELRVYQQEDHLSVAVCGINWAVSRILDPERLPTPSKSHATVES
ncbi:uncharacterized protein Z518_11137 [Rhinocladiella mackenziei CBS 650.93]|uniref:Siderophore esterase IroE-like protein n=1 Tax=Rhinocladiella mackenziei CBS 650.93 TaxID=1442369 RepID=A0A0D2ISI1_9EURO|nr:uncharacterized protein Z518_11137 [Rhinocladiella mackenziei CBS 650.93]KIW99724.1 hypothetical protein Z518_11137 [Rhinocladiella mackenziei CBS 650.93]